MATPTWQPTKLYPPGYLVVPRTQPPTGPVALANPNFEGGNTGWANRDAGWAIVNNPPHGAYTGTWAALFTQPVNDAAERAIRNDAAPGVVVGQVVTASAMVNLDGPNQQVWSWIALEWLDGSGNILSKTDGNRIARRSGQVYERTAVTGAAPAGAAAVRVAIYAKATNYSPTPSIRADNVTWDFATQNAGLQYKAVQAATGFSAATEPAWPGVLGQQVIDNEVIWEAVSMSRVVWEASPILMSGPTEPTWPEDVGGFVADNTISWEVISRSVDQAPASKIVALAVSKIFAGDVDIDRFSATNNPLDWTTESNAGYLPTGLQQYGANPIAAQGLYRGNLVVFNSEAFQMWQIDQDPQNMALLDALPLGSTRHHALSPVGDELLFLSSQGVRSISIAAGSTNLASGDVGKPVDPLVLAAIAAADAAGIEPMALYYPAAGQYWLIVSTASTSQAFVLTMNTGSKAWSRYTFPFPIDDWAILGDALYLRSADAIYRLEEGLAGDVLEEGGAPVPFAGAVQFHWLDMGAPGVNKMLAGFDVVCDGAPAVSFGYDQANFGTFTAPYTVPADTVPGMLIPMPLTAPSVSVRLDWTGETPWHFRALNLYVRDQRLTA